MNNSLISKPRLQPLPVPDYSDVQLFQGVSNSVFTLFLADNLQVQGRKTDRHTVLRFSQPQFCLSSAVLLGGFSTISDFLNLRVDVDAPFSEPAEQTLLRYATAEQLGTDCLAMMTAASMNSFRIAQAKSSDVTFTVLLTSGLGNARRAGEESDGPAMAYSCSVPDLPLGTINIILHCDKPLSPAAMAEALMMVTEAKAAILQDLQVISSKSSVLATGTGTDSIAIVCPKNRKYENTIPFVGKHLHLGQQLARAVIVALRSAIEYELR